MLTRFSRSLSSEKSKSRRGHHEPADLEGEFGVELTPDLEDAICCDVVTFAHRNAVVERPDWKPKTRCGWQRLPWGQVTAGTAEPRKITGGTAPRATVSAADTHVKGNSGQDESGPLTRAQVRRWAAGRRAVAGETAPGQAKRSSSKSGFSRRQDWDRLTCPCWGPEGTGRGWLGNVEEGSGGRRPR